MDFDASPQTAKQVIIQGIREAEADPYQRFTGSERVIRQRSSRVEPSGNVLLELDARRMGGERTEAILPSRAGTRRGVRR